MAAESNKVISQYIILIHQCPWRAVQDDTFERGYTKVPLSIYSPNSWFFINPYY